MNIIYFLMIIILSVQFKLAPCFIDRNDLVKKKNEWLKNHLTVNKKIKRSSNIIFTNEDLISQSKRPCPATCNCNYDTINCNDLIDKCDECTHWPQIDFNQIYQLKRDSFKNFKFATNRTTHIIIYKLLNSTIGADTFNGLTIEKNSQLEITFQYNSLIRFDKNALNGLVMNSNSTLIFNFPYTTQVIFLSKFFNGVTINDNNSKIILRILKSFSVRFMGDLNLNKQKVSNKPENLNEEEKWSLSNGQFIIDVKSTHLVKFEENAFSNLNFKKSSKFYIDMELIEKLMIQRNAFSNLNLNDNSRMTLYAKQITFIDFKAFSFAGLNLMHKSRVQIYLEELASSLCVQRNVFSNMRLRNDDTSFNFSIINSKNVQFMHDTFSGIEIESKFASLFIGVFNMPSLLLIYQNKNFYEQFLNERLEYLSIKNNMNNNNNLYPLNSEYFYNHLNINNGLNTIGLTDGRYHGLNYPSNKFDLSTFYLKNKQTYSYNVSIEQNCFSNLTIKYNENSPEKNIIIAADNIHTILVDNNIFNTTNKLNNINFVLNVKNVGLSKHSLDHVKQSTIEFLREPKLIKFGLSHNKSSNHDEMIKRRINIIGLNVLKSIVQTNKLDEETFDRQSEFDYYSESNNNKILEQDTFDDRNELRNFNENRRAIIQSYTLFDDNCYLYRQKDTQFNLVLRSKFDPLIIEQQQQCSCQIIYFYANKLKNSNLPCKLNDKSFVDECLKQQELKCLNENGKEKNEEIFLNEFVKFWKYCISEKDPSNEYSLDSLNDQDTGGSYYFNNFNDIDGLFAASSSSAIDQLNENRDSSLSSTSSSSFPSNNEATSSNIGKIIGIVIICFVSGIVLFMIAVNIIQYKFRNDLLDDLEYSSQAPNNLNNTNDCSESSLENSNESKKNGKNNSNNYDDDDDNHDDDDNNGNNLNTSNKGNTISYCNEKKTTKENKHAKKIKLGHHNNNEEDNGNNGHIVKNKYAINDKDGKDGNNYLNEIIALNENREDNDSYLDGYEDEEEDQEEYPQIFYEQNDANDNKKFAISTDKITNDSGKSSSASNTSDPILFESSATSSPVTKKISFSKTKRDSCDVKRAKIK